LIGVRLAHTESLLLAGGVFVLFMSFSRIGWLSFLLALAYLMLLMNMALTRWVKKRLQQRLGSGRGAIFSGFISGAIIFGFGAVYAGLIAGLVLVGASNPGWRASLRKI
jgi:hypothetical protein